MIFNPVVSGGGGAEQAYTITVDSSLSLTTGIRLPNSSVAGQFCNSDGVYLGRINSILTEDGKSVPYFETGGIEKSLTFVMPKGNVVVS